MFPVNSGDSHSDMGGFCRTLLRVTLSSSPTKLRVRPESMIVDTLGGICTLNLIYKFDTALLII